jgi:hypothetical protein
LKPPPIVALGFSHFAFRISHYHQSRMEASMNRRVLLAALFLAVTAGGCDLLNPARPTPHDDTTLFGNLIEVWQEEGETTVWWVRMRIGLPRAFARAEEAEGKPTPTMEEGTVADVRVSTDTVVLVAGRPSSVDDVDPGTEVVVVPVAGTTRMIGTSNITVDAEYLTDFETYRRWQLPGLAVPGEGEGGVEDPTAVNSAGVEGSPLPVGDGRVLYFSARLRVPPVPGGRWLGARRDGMVEPGPDSPVVERSYRTELGESGWAPPELVRFANVDDQAVVRISWIAEDETSCLVTVVGFDGTSWVGSAGRATPDSGWGEVRPLDLLTGENPGDAVYLAGSATKIVYAASLPGSPTGDLMLLDTGAAEEPQLLTPPINSVASEWGPRVGPGNELFFVRDDRQLVMAGGEIRPLAIPTAHRVALTQAAPTSDGEWVFFCMPRYTPGELDQDIHAARWLGENRLGKPIPVDRWRP